MKKKKFRLIAVFLFFLIALSLFNAKKAIAAVFECGKEYTEALITPHTCNCANRDIIYIGGQTRYCCGWYINYWCYATPSGSETESEAYEFCANQIGTNQTDAFNKCEACMVEKEGVWTAIGCIPQTTDGVVKTLVEIGVIISGAVVLVMILAGAFMLSTSQGDPKKTQDAKELITSAIIGLLFVIFSVTILQFIGFSIIRIPGFG